jgi:hypothetical protein
MPVMQELLDLSGTIAVTIRKKDLDTAGKDLARYQARYQDLNNLILKLDMNESEIADFSRNAKQQNEILHQFVNTSESIQSLKKLEIQYRRDEDPDSLTTVHLQGKVLEQKIRSLRDEYGIVSENLADQAESKGLYSQEVRKGRNEIDTYTREVLSDQDAWERQNLVSEDISPAVSLLVQPAQARYRDYLDIFGFISGSKTAGEPVWILINEEPVLLAITDDAGEFKIPYEVGMIRAGNHSLVAFWKNIRSEEQMVTIFPDDTTLSLGIRAVKDRSAINLSGILSARQPVQLAPIIVLVNNETWNTTLTDDSGRYLTALTLPEGTYSVCTMFDNASFPLNSSVSQPFIVTSSGSSILSVEKSHLNTPDYRWISLFLLPCFFGIAWWYIRRSRRIRVIPYNGSPADIDGTLVPGTETMEDSPVVHHAGEEPVLRYPLTISDTAYLMYIRLISRLTGDHSSSGIRSLTPREIAEILPDHQGEEGIRIFIRFYELIRYGGYDREEDLEGLTSVLNEIEPVITGDRHEE